jgi:hypothetical protein
LVAGSNWETQADCLDCNAAVVQETEASTVVSVVVDVDVNVDVDLDAVILTCLPPPPVSDAGTPDAGSPKDGGTCTKVCKQYKKEYKCYKTGHKAHSKCNTKHCFWENVCVKEVTACR